MIRHSTVKTTRSGRDHLLRPGLSAISAALSANSLQSLTLEFDSYLSRLEQVERAARLDRIREHGALAVADALSDLIR